MHKFIIAFLLLYSVALKANDTITLASVDSVTYQYYLTGEWDKLIETGLKAIDQGIDFKFLRQRIGYAYFIKKDYYASQKHYEKALQFDKEDAITKEYLYYCALYTGNVATLRYSASKLTAEQKKILLIKPFKPAASLDLEYNYKSNTSDARSNPTYFRAGISSYLGYRLTLYQSVSNYKQTIDTFGVKQLDYLALANWSFSSHSTFTLAYHYLNTDIEGYKYPGNLIFGRLSTVKNRFSFSLNGSYFKYDIGKFGQIGVQAGVTLPGRRSIYFITSLNEMIESSNNRMIFSQVAGINLSKKLWAEGSVTFGNLQNYTDHNALYVYNSVDPTVFRTGASLYWYLHKNITLYGNYLYDTKEVEQTSGQYIQHSFLTGIIWKL